MLANFLCFDLKYSLLLSERVDNAALSSAVSYEILGQMTERALFARYQDSKQDT